MFNNVDILQCIQIFLQHILQLLLIGIANRYTFTGNGYSIFVPAANFIYRRNV